MMAWKAGFLVLLIFLCVVFGVIKVQTLGDDYSDFNTSTRYELGQFAILRVLFGLHKDGDARKAYLTDTKPLTIAVAHPEGIAPDPAALETFANQVERYIGRSVTITEAGTIPDGMLSAEEVAGIASDARKYVDSSYLLLIYAEDFVQGEEIGQTVQEFGVLISHNRIQDLTSEYPKTMSKYVASTILHEFGHQLGLDHVADDTCIMNNYVESPRARAISTPVEMCPAEIVELERIRDSLR